MAGIIEAQEAEAAPLGLGVEGGRLGRFHLGAIAAEPNDAWGAAPHWRAAAKGDTPLIRGFPYDEELRLSVRHLELAAMMRPADRAFMDLGLGARGEADLAEQAPRVNRSPSIRRGGP
jgi:hypothetical protein